MTSNSLPNGAATPTAQKLEIENSLGMNETAEDVPPDGGYGWVCVGACFAINCFTWGTVSVNCHIERLVRA